MSGRRAPGTPSGLSAGRIRARLSSTPATDDPTRVDLDLTTGDWRPGFRDRLRDELVAAAVLVPIVDRASELFVLLTSRSPRLKHHAGQIGFPGGRAEPGDADIVATALRETREELGIVPGEVSVAGRLPPVPTLSGYAVTPVVGMLREGTRLTLDRTEVEAAFEVPLAFLMDPANARRGSGDEDRVAFPLEFQFEGRRIWGVTASILVLLRDALFERNRPRPSDTD